MRFYPLTKETLAALLAGAGFTRADYYGDFRSGPWTPDGRLLVVRAVS